MSMISISLILIIIFCIIILPSQVTSAKEIIGTQRNSDSPQGMLTLCLGNVFYPVTVCAGTDKNDTLVASPDKGAIYGLGGADKIKGLLGSEVSFGNGGDDAIQAGNGSSTIFGNDGNDTLIGGGGPNPLFGNISTFVYGDNGNDHLIGGVDHDIMSGGPGHDFFTCTGKQDIIVDFKDGQDNMTGNCLIL
jgi:Ca2+-binding RTX toxin-like protein